MEYYDAKEDYAEIPQLEQYIEGISNFDKSYHKIAPYEILDKFYKACKIFPIQSFSSNLKNRKFFRIRAAKTMNIFSENLSDIKTFSYPPANYCGANRANLKNKSVFYCSDTLETPFYESRLERGDYGYLGVWECVTDNVLKYTCILPSDLDKRNRWINHTDIKYRQSLSAFVYEKHQQELYLSNYLADKFINEVSPYPLTSALSDVILYSNDHVDFLVYPSVQAKLLRCNIAFHPKAVDKFLELKEVLRFHVTKKDDFQMNYRIDLVGEVKDNVIKWREATIEDDKRYQ